MSLQAIDIMKQNEIVHDLHLFLLATSLATLATLRADYFAN
jgi:hypothetical protein